jgi:hypothetical protein
MIGYVFATIITALFATFTILLTERLGYREKIQIRAPKLIAELFSCDFCLSFWVCLLWSVVFSVITCNILFIGCCVTSPPLTRKLL